MIIAIILTITLGMLLFFSMAFTIYTESKDFYLTFYVTDFENKPIQNFKIESIELMSQVNEFVTSATGLTEKFRINSHAVKTIYTVKVPSILYFKPVFRFPSLGHQYFQVKFGGRWSKHKIFIHKDQQSLIFQRGELYQNYGSLKPDPSSQIVYFNHIGINQSDITIHLYINNKKESQ